MKRYFLKTQNSLQGQIIAGSLVATFAFGTVGSGFAGAMEENLEIINIKDDSEKNQGKKDEEIFLEEFKFNDDNMAFIKEIKENYEKWEGLVFGDEMKAGVKKMFETSDESKFDKVWEDFLEKRSFTINFLARLIALNKKKADSADDIWENAKGNAPGFFKTFAYEYYYRDFYLVLNSCSSSQKRKIDYFEETYPETDESDQIQHDNLCKNLFHNKKIFWSVIVVALVISIFLIVYFVIPGGNKQGTVGTDEANSNSSQGGDNQVNNNELNPTEQKQTEENSGIKQGSGVGKKILKGSVASATGIGLVTSGTYLYGKISSKHKNATEQKAQNDNKKW